MTAMKITFKTNGGASAQLDVEPSWNLATVKEKLGPLLDLQPTACRLIFKGRITKDTDTIESIKIQDGMSMHVVRTGVPPTPSESTAAAAAQSSTAAPAAASTAPPAAAPSATPAANPFANNPFLAGMGMGGMGGLGDMGGLGGMGGMGGMPGMPPMNPQMLQQMLQNPMMQQMMQEMLRNPETLRTMFQANPMLQSLANSNPMVRETLNNPELLRTVLDPATLQAASQMYGAQGAAPAPGGAAGGMPDLNALLGQMGMGAPGAGSAPPPAMPDFSALLGALNRPPASPGAAPTATAAAPGAGAAAGGAPNIMDAVNRLMQEPAMRTQMMNMMNPAAAAAPPAGPDGTPLTAEEETRFASALRQLEDMGFTDRNSNAWALRSTGGEVNEAINLLLEYNFGN